jgi:folate-binding protein YgfZ
MSAELRAPECLSVALASLGVLRARGADVVAFLQGQLSGDVAQLAAGRSLFTGYHNPQGRVIALLRLVQLAPDDVLAILPRELVASVVQRLAKFILRAKVKLADDSAAWTLTGLMVGDRGATGAPAAQPARGLAALIEQLPAAVDGSATLAGSLAVRLAPPQARWLLITPQSVALPPALLECPAATEEAWRRASVAAGEPEVVGATSEEFVAQMLNLDALGAIAFDKGCYTGQEVIARAHYRGRVKRRMQRFMASGSRLLHPGDAGELADGRPYKVVSAVSLAGAGCEFLAVAPLISAAPEAGNAAAASASAPAAARSAPRLEAAQLALPYALPE